MKRRTFLNGMASLPLLYFFCGRKAFAAPRIQNLSNQKISRIAFGSCCMQNDPQPIWRTIKAARPDFFIFCGDNVYADSDDASYIQKQYETLGDNPDYQDFIKSVPVLATWDDHDYGADDSGVEYPLKHQSKKIMLDFFNEPAMSVRRSRDGIYTSYYYGDPPHRLQIILLDLRWFRTSLKRDASGYIPNDDPHATLLGEEQWRWLQAELSRPANYRLLVSSTQFVSSEHMWEKWANFPIDRARLLRLIDDLDLRNLTILSGDMHYGELSYEQTPGGRDVFDLTSSGMNHFESGQGIPNSKALARFDTGENFGFVEIDWSPRTVSLEVRSLQGNSVIERRLAFQSPVI